MSTEAPNKDTFLYKWSGLILIIIIAAITTGLFSLWKDSVKSTTELVTTMAVNAPSEPTTNPADPYAPMPLRVGTVGATAYHRPFCKYAKQSLTNHGLAKRINYWTREQVADSGRIADNYCMASVFDCADVDEADFATSGNDPWCGANVRSSGYVVDGLDARIAGKTLCRVHGTIGIFVENPDDCIYGKFRASDPECNQDACINCTADCDTVCLGCVKITMAPINKITFGMGDGNKDGDADIDDYLYFHECYSGPIAATIPCQNVFDYDADADVDETDFDLFVQSYNTGNSEWIQLNHPNAIVDLSTPELPLRVGTIGSNYYHRLDCPSVNASWERHGLDKREDFYTWDQIEKSGRVPDLNVCLPGTRANPSGSWQNCSFDSDKDGTPNCMDKCPEDALKTVPGICGCGIPDTDSNNNGIPDCRD